MATEAQIIANRRNAQKSISTQSLSMSLGTPADCFMQNKANLLDAQMNVSSAKTMNYEQITMNNEPTCSDLACGEQGRTVESISDPAHSM